MKPNDFNEEFIFCVSSINPPNCFCEGSTGRNYSVYLPTQSQHKVREYQTPDEECCSQCLLTAF